MGVDLDERSVNMIAVARRLMDEVNFQLDSNAWVILNDFSVSSVEKVYDAASLRHCTYLLGNILSVVEGADEMAIRILGRAHIEAFLFGAYIHFGGVDAIRTVRLNEDTAQATMRTELEEWDKWLEATIKKNRRRRRKIREVIAQIESRRKGGLTPAEREHLIEPHVPRATFRKEAVEYLGKGIQEEPTVEFGVAHAVSWLSENGPKLGFATERFDPLYHVYRAYSSIGPHPNISVYESYVIRDERKTFIRSSAEPLRTIYPQILLDSLVSTAQLAEWILQPRMKDETFASQVLREHQGANDDFRSWRPR